jgi:hypothetical protein
MRGDDNNPATLLVYLSLETFVPKNHPLNTNRAMSDRAPAELNS